MAASCPDMMMLPFERDPNLKIDFITQLDEKSKMFSQFLLEDSD